MRPVLLPLLLVAACQQAEPPVNKQAAAAPRAAPHPEGAVGAAERLVRERLGNPEGVAFVNPRRTASEGVTIICGQYAQGAAQQRYIVVDSTEVFIEPQLQPGEMDRYFAEYCEDQRRG